MLELAQRSPLGSDLSYVMHIAHSTHPVTASYGTSHAGVTVVVKGSAASGGEFEVTGWRFAGIPPPQRSIESAAAADGVAKETTAASGRDSSFRKKYVALVSGLGIGSSGGEPLGVSLLVDWLTGVLGSPEDNERAAQVPDIAFVRTLDNIFSILATCFASKGSA